MTRPIAVAALLVAAALAGCDKNAVQELPLGPIAGARIKFFNFGVNDPSVNFYANTTKMTGVLSATGQEATTGVAYGSAGNAGLYSLIAPGQYSLTGRISATTDKDLPIDTLSATIADGKSYSLFLSGFYSTTNKLVDGFVIQDSIPSHADYKVASVRFVHAISNANAMTLYAKNTDTTITKDSIAIGGAVAYKGAGAFTAVPAGVYNLITRYTGSNTSVITRAAVSFVGGRVYTIGARGDITVVSTTATNRPILDNTPNW
jgi:uncharacterized protein DUF4397